MDHYTDEISSVELDAGIGIAELFLQFHLQGSILFVETL